MAELTNVTRSSFDYQAGRKAHPTSLNRVRCAVIESAAAYAAAADGDTFGTNIVIPAGTQFLAPVTVSNEANTASLTLSLGLRDPVTKVAVAAAGLLSACSLASAQCAQFNTGTKLTAGQLYKTATDLEIYGTFAGAAAGANKLWRAEVRFVAP